MCTTYNMYNTFEDYQQYNTIILHFLSSLSRTGNVITMKKNLDFDFHSGNPVQMK